MACPNFFLVGSAKCGTSSMHEYLKKHPDITMSEIKEPDYYYRDYHHSIREGFNRRNKPKNMREYLRLFIKDNKRIGESSARYFKSLTAPYLIKRDYPNAKILIILRNPVDMLYSLYKSMLIYREDEEDFIKAIEYKEVRQGKGDEIIPPYMEYVDYYNNTKRWLDLFGIESVKVIILEEFLKNKQKIFNEILGFLDLKEIIIKFDIVNGQKLVKHKNINDFICKLTRVIPGFLKFRFLTILIRKFRQRYLLEYDKKEITPKKEKKYILKKLKPEIIKLGELLDKDLINLWI